MFTYQAVLAEAPRYQSLDPVCAAADRWEVEVVEVWPPEARSEVDKRSGRVGFDDDCPELMTEREQGTPGEVIHRKCWW